MAVQKHFKCLDGVMYCEESSLTEILTQTEKRYKSSLTPLFVYSKKKLRENVRAYTDALNELNCPYQLNFSVKANQNLTILKEFQSLGTSATLVSGNELRLALEAGFEPSLLMFNGGGKCAWETKLAVKNDVLINVDSEWDLKQTLDICRHGFHEPKRAKVLLRMNLNIDPQVHKYVNTGNMDCKFGLSGESAESCIQILQEPGCPAELVGLHSHMGSTIYHTDVFRICVEKLLRFRQTLLDRGFTNIQILNVGGGLGIDYLEQEPETRPWRNETENNQRDIVALNEFLLKHLEDARKRTQTADEIGLKKAENTTREILDTITSYRDEKISFFEMRQTVNTKLALLPYLKSDVERLCPFLTPTMPSHPSPKDLVQSVSDLLKDTGITLMLEPGRSLIANACVLFARVLGCKHQKNKRYVITDASMTEVIRPCLYGSYHHVTAVESQDKRTKYVYDVVGPVCESADFIGKDRLLTVPDKGYIVVHDVGAYCHSMSSNYNARMKAAEVLVDGSTWRLIRRQDTFEDLLAPYKNLA